MDRSSRILLGILVGFTMLTFAGRRRRCGGGVRRTATVQGKRQCRKLYTQVTDNIAAGRRLVVQATPESAEQDLNQVRRLRQQSEGIIRQIHQLGQGSSAQTLSTSLDDCLGERMLNGLKVKIQQVCKQHQVQPVQATAPPYQIPAPPPDVSAAAACGGETDLTSKFKYESRRKSGIGYASMGDIAGQRQRLRAPTVQNDDSLEVDEPEFIQRGRNLSSCKRLNPSSESKSHIPASFPVVERLELDESAEEAEVHQSSRRALLADIQQGVRLNRVGVSGHQRSKSQLAVGLDSVRDHIAPQDEDSDNDVEEEEWQ